jgi:hyperosmotically inducible protein
MDKLRISKIAALLLSAAGLVACYGQNAGLAEREGRNLDQAAQTTEQAIADTAITSKIETAILAKRGLKMTMISVETTDGVVMLTGTVISRKNSRRVGAIASGMRGVRRVNNQLKVDPSSSG